MGFYLKNGGRIGTGNVTTSSRGVHDLNVSQLFSGANFPSGQFGGLVTYLSDYMSEYRNASFYSYNLDGNDITISDGGADMYDGGNYTNPWLLSGATVSATGLSYATTTPTTTDSSFVYASLGYGTSPDKRPLSMIGYRATPNTVIGWQKNGNQGADGGGLQDNGNVYSGETVNGFTMYAYRRQIYSAGDPSICDLFMIFGRPQWGSSYGTTTSFAAASTDSGQCHFFMSSASNVMAVATLLSKSSGVAVTVAEMQTVIQSWTNRINLYFGY